MRLAGLELDQEEGGWVAARLRKDSASFVRETRLVDVTYPMQQE